MKSIRATDEGKRAFEDFFLLEEILGNVKFLTKGTPNAAYLTAAFFLREIEKDLSTEDSQKWDDFRWKSYYSNFSHALFALSKAELNMNENMSNRLKTCQKDIKEMYDEVHFLRTHAYDIHTTGPEAKQLENCYACLQKAYDLLSAARRFYDGNNLAYAKHLAKTAGFSSELWD
jgi:hypothetical protein